MQNHRMQDQKNTVRQSNHQGQGTSSPASGSDGGFTCSDDGNADRLVSRHGAELHYCYEIGWVVWDGKRWTRDKLGEVRRRAVDTVRHIGIEAAKEEDIRKSKDYMEWASKSLAHYRIKALIACAESKHPVPILIDEFDRHPLLLNVANGTLDLESDQYREHRREDLLMRATPVPHDPKAKCPTWLGFLERVMDRNPDLIGFLQKAVGYSLTGSVEEECFFVLHGNGANGKSTFIETVRALLGDYAVQTPVETFMAKRGDSIPNDVAQLRGARFVSASETEEGRRLGEAQLKHLTGGDTVPARFLRREFFHFLPEFKLWLACNHKPKVRGTDDAIWRRIRLIPFLVQIPAHERDPKLKGRNGKLQAELSGILNWALEGLRKWQEDGLGVPQAVAEATSDYRTDMDVTGSFLKDRCIVAEGATVGSGDLYDAYCAWCGENGEQTMGKKAFGATLTERGFTRDRGPGGKHIRLGIGLVVYPDTEPEYVGKGEYGS